MWSLSVQFKRLRLIVALIINHFWNRTGQILTIANNSAAFWLYLLFGMILVCFCPQTHWLTSPDKNKPKTKITKKNILISRESLSTHAQWFSFCHAWFGVSVTSTYNNVSISITFFVVFSFFLLSCSVYKKIYTSADFYVILDDIFIFNLQMTSFEITFPHLDGRNLGEIGKNLHF